VQNISEQSPNWYTEKALEILTPEVKLKLMDKVAKELQEEYASVLSKANWFQMIGLNFKLQRLKQKRTQIAFQNYLDNHQHPETSNESLW